MRRVLSDLALGVRLAVGGGRTSLARFVLSSIGIAVAVAVLLVAASVGTMTHERQLRNYAERVNETPIPGVDPVYVRYAGTEFRGEWVEATYVYPSGDRSPVPVGLRELPGPGEMYASPALIDLLRSAEGELLRPRFPERIAGTIDKSMVPKPGDLIAYVGADASLAESEIAVAAYSFGRAPPSRELDPAMTALLLVGAVALLLPVFLFVSTASRIAGAERDRRLSALRLVGSGARQVRRIAAAESLVSAFAGLVLGGLVFLVARQFAEQVVLFDLRVYVSDVVPHPALVVFIVIAVPAMSVLSALFALRRTIIEPLGVVRQGKPVRRRLWWRLALIAAGVALLVTQAGFEENTVLWGYAIAAGASLLLIGVPVLLPWLVERVAGRLRGGPTSWQLAIRRLQLDSGTSARVVGGVAVVLSGAIALQTVLMTAEAAVRLPDENGDRRPPAVEVSTDTAHADKVMADVRTASGVTGAYQVRNVTAYQRGAADDTPIPIAVLDCTALRTLANVHECTNGDTFQVNDRNRTPVPAGTPVEFREYSNQTDPTQYETTGNWTLPQRIQTITKPNTSGLYAQLLITPAAVKGAPLPDWGAMVIAQVANNLTSTQLEGIRNAVAKHSWHAYVYSYNTGPDLSARQRVFVTIRTTLYAGSIFTLLLAGVSLLVLALEHIRERRRPLAVLAASGVPRAVLGRSLLWQITLPIALGIAVALLTGISLAALIMRLTRESISLDWPGIALLCTGALALSVLVSTMTLPFLRNATRLTTLRAE